MTDGRRGFRGAVFLAIVTVIPVACSSGFLDRLSAGPPPTEAGPSASASANASALPTGCDAAASFCDDFDQGALGATWTDASVTPNGAIALVEGGVSPPFAFQASYVTGTVNTTAYLTKFVGGSDTIRCELDLLIPAPPAQGEVDYIAFITNAPGNFSLYKLYFSRYDAQWVLGEYGLRVDGGTIDRSHAMSSSIPTGVWTHVVFQTNEQLHVLSISIGDGGKPDEMAGIQGFVTTSREVQVGIAFASNNANTSAALYDNVTCDWTL